MIRIRFGNEPSTDVTSLLLKTKAVQGSSSTASRKASGQRMEIVLTYTIPSRKREIEQHDSTVRE